MIKHLISKPINKIIDFFYLKQLRKGITKSDFTIISNDCVGGVIYHRLGKKFCSPFINLFLNHDDFLTFLSNQSYYLNSILIEAPSNLNYPIGILGKEKPIEIHFMHYSNFREAKEIWERRKKRIIQERTFVIFNLTNSLDIEYVRRYVNNIEKLNLQNVLVLTRFDINNSNVLKINFDDLPEFHNAQILAPVKHTHMIHIDQIDYKKVFNRFDT